MVTELPDTPESIVLSSDDEPMDEDTQEDLKMGQPDTNDNTEDVELIVFGNDTDSSFNSGKELVDEFDSDYDSSRDY